MNLICVILHAKIEMSICIWNKFLTGRLLLQLIQFINQYHKCPVVVCFEIGKYKLRYIAGRKTDWDLSQDSNHSACPKATAPRKERHCLDGTI